METVVAKELAVTVILKYHLPLFFLLPIGLCRFHITQIDRSQCYDRPVQISVSQIIVVHLDHF